MEESPWPWVAFWIGLFVFLSVRYSIAHWPC